MRATLSPQALSRLRARYDSRAVTGSAATATAALFSDAAPLFASLTGVFFERQDLLSPAERELLVIALFSDGVPAWMLAVHVYLGLMEGLTPEKVAASALLAATYRRGVAAFTQAIAVISRALSVLSRLSNEGDETCDTARILRELRREFPA